MQLYFGPDETFFFNDRKGNWKWRVSKEFTDYMRSNSISKINNIALGENGTFLVSYCNTLNQNINYWHSPQNNYAALKSWLFNEGVAHDRESLTVSLGPNDSFFAADNQGHRWRNIPESLCDYYQKYTRPDLFARSRVNTVDLGHNGSYLGIGVDNTWFWNLGNEYPALTQMIQQRGTTNCKFATINPFAPDQHFAVFEDETIHWSLPPSWVSDMQSLLQKYAVGTASQAVSIGQNVPQNHQTKKPSFFNRPSYSSPPPYWQQYQTSQTVTSPGGSPVDFNQAMQFAQSSLNAVNGAQGQGGNLVSSGAQLVNGLAGNGLMVGQLIGQTTGAMAGCVIM